MMILGYGHLTFVCLNEWSMLDSARDFCKGTEQAYVPEVARISHENALR
jgi:hypothetical protein